MKHNFNRVPYKTLIPKLLNLAQGLTRTKSRVPGFMDPFSTQNNQQHDCHIHPISLPPIFHFLSLT